MAQDPERERPDHDKISFELERFELGAEGRIELSGRWFGVRGRRFVRPTLTLLGEGERARCLADLEHKPWSAEDGESWQAAFTLPADTGAVTEAELAVAPDIAVQLSPPAALRDRVPKRGAGAGAVPATRRVREPPLTTAAQPAPVAAPATDEPAAAGADAKAEARAEKAADTGAEAEARAEKAAERVREATVKVRSALSRRDAALAAQEQALAGRDAALAERDAATGERDSALRERDAAVAERESALRAWRAAAAERDAMAQERDDAASHLEELSSGHEAELAELRAQLERGPHEHESAHRAAAAPAAAPSPPLRGRPNPLIAAPAGTRPSRLRVWPVRLVVLLVLMAAVAVVAALVLRMK